MKMLAAIPVALTVAAALLAPTPATAGTATKPTAVLTGCHLNADGSTTAIITITGASRSTPITWGTSRLDLTDLSPSTPIERSAGQVVSPRFRLAIDYTVDKIVLLQVRSGHDDLYFHWLENRKHGCGPAH